MILPWDAARLEADAARADRNAIAGARSPYLAAARDLRGSLVSASTAANPTRGAAGTRSALIAAAPEMGRMARAGVEAEAAARRQAIENSNMRARARAEDGAQLFGGLLSAGGSGLGMLTSALGGSGGAAGGGAGGLLGAAAPIAGTAMGGPVGGMLGGAVGSALTSAPAAAPAAPAPTMASSIAPTVPTVARFNPFAGMVSRPAPTAVAPVAAPAAAPMAPANPMTDAEWAAADEEARRLRARLGY